MPPDEWDVALRRMLLLLLAVVAVLGTVRVLFLD